MASLYEPVSARANLVPVTATRCGCDRAGGVSCGAGRELAGRLREALNEAMATGHWRPFDQARDHYERHMRGVRD